MNKKLLLGIIAGICVVALVLGLVLGLSNCAGTEPTEPTGSSAPSDEPTDPTEPEETDPDEYIPEVEGGISYYSGKPDYSWYDPTSSKKEYTLYTADQLYGLVELVNSMSMTFEGATIKIANNMVINEGDASKWGRDEFMVPWVPIGKGWGSAFSGTLDGQGHYISGLYSVQAKNNGFIAYSQGATVKNLAIVNSYFCNTNEDDVQAEVMATFVGRGRGVTLQNLYSDAILVSGGYSTGGIVGYTQSAWDTVTKDCLVESCVFAGQIKNSSGKGTGGILGHDNGSKYSVTVKNCLFIGSLQTTNVNCGGIVGAFSGESKLINCVSAGSVTSSSNGFSGVALIGSAGANSTVSNSYYVSTKSGKAIGTGTPAVEEGNMGLVRATMKGMDVAKVMTALDFVNAWTAIEDSYPVPTGVKALYDLVKKPLTEDTSDDSDKASSGSSSSGSASVGEVDTSWYSDDKTEFTISTVKQLYGLAQLVNEGKDFSGKTVKLSKDLVINSGSASKWTAETTGLQAWVPIGSTSAKQFKGTFDGQGHYISGIFSIQAKDNGLFGYANGATVKNLAVINSYFENTGATSASTRAAGQRLSAFVATGEDVKLSGLYSNAILKNAGTDLGGIIGYAKGATTVDSCAFAGTILSDSFERRNYGGIVGYNERGVLTVSNCLFSGKMDTKTHLQGGIVGRSNINGTTIKNCVSVGEVKSSHGNISSDNAIIGAIKADLEDTTVTVENCYYLTDSRTCGYSENTDKGNATLKETNVVKLEEAAAKGTNVASAMTKLDFKSTWSALADDYPIPTAVKAVYVATYKAHTHAWATDWTSNSTHHWHECTGDECDVSADADKNGYGEHVYTDDKDETCNTCNYKRTIVVDDGKPSVYSGTPDTSWYNEEDTVFVLTTADQLYGFAELVNGGNDFSGKTVKLGKDMVINEGDAKTWGTTAPTHKWTPIAVATGARFKGVFDGQGHYISGLYSVQELNNGLFVYLEGGTVQNVAVLNSYFENTGDATKDNSEVLSSVVGRIYDAGTVKNVYSNAYLVSTGKDYHTGGIIGWARSSKDTVPTIDSCIFAGTIISNTEASGSHVGGIIGGNDSNAKVVEISNCLMIGHIYSNDSNVGGIIGTMRGNNTKLVDCVVATAIQYTGTGSNRGPVAGNLNTDKGQLVIENCYYVAEAGTDLYGNVADAEKVTLKDNAAITAEQLKLQASFPGLDFTKTWTQTAEVPVPTELKAVYEANLKIHTHVWATDWTSNSTHHWHECTGDECDVIADADKNGYGEHVYTDDKDETCNTCNYKRTVFVDDGTPSVYSGTPDTSWYNEDDLEFVLTTADQLMGFAELVNAGNDFSGKTVKLGKNMIINESKVATWASAAPSHKWTPIGAAADKPFKGILDGQGKYISGIYSVQDKHNALIAHAEGATVKNLAVIDSYFENNKYSSGRAESQNLSAFVAYGNGVTLQGLYSNALLHNGGENVGGICGYAQNGTTIDSCLFTGVITGEAGLECWKIGGIVGFNNSGKITISNSLFNGKIDGKFHLVGGILGRSDVNGTALDSCVSVGTVLSSSTNVINKDNGLIGALKNAKVDVKNCYYLSGYRVLGFGEGTGEALVTDCAALDAAVMKGNDVANVMTKLDFDAKWSALADNYPVPTAVKAMYEAHLAAHVCVPSDAWTHDADNHWHACSDVTCNKVSDVGGHNFGANGTDDKCSVCNRPNPNSGNTGTPNTEWYDNADENAKIAYIMTEDDLLGLAQLVNSGENNFAGWTIYLGADLMFNEGDASTWNKDSGETLGLIPWTPIGSNWTNSQNKAIHFAGTFDGLGHTISGIYSVQDANNALFAYTRNATVKNLSVVNSYFENNGSNPQVLATFVGRGQGVQLSQLYSDAILVGGGYSTGGICGYIQSREANNASGTILAQDCEINSCIFAGEIRNASDTCGGILGHDNGKTNWVTVKDCIFSGTITCTTKNVGGLVGALNSDNTGNNNTGVSTLEGCVSTGTVTSTVDGWSNVALVGKVSNQAVVKNNRYQNVAGVKKFGSGTPAVDENNIAIGPVIVSAEKPTITTQPTGSAYEPNGAATALKVVAAVTDNGTLSYQWYKSTTSATDGFTAIDGETEATCTPSRNENAWYYCEVTSTNLYVSGTKTAKVTSDAVKIHFHDWATDWSKDTINHYHECAGCDDLKDKARHASNNGGAVCDTCGETIVLAEAPDITGLAGPLNGAEVGTEVELIISASVSDGNLTYQWYSNAVNSNENGTAIEDATAATYKFTPDAAGNYYYYCVVTNTNSAEQVNETVSEAVTVHVHGWKTEWAYDANNHWHECSVDSCPVTEDSAKNGYGAHSLVHNLCDCGYVGPVSYYDATLGNDISWYLANTKATSYRLTNVNQLFGLAALVNGETGDASISGPLTFKDVEFTLACNMVINQSPASGWGEENTTGLIEWTPIGYWKSGWPNVFMGHLNGDYHYISGIYCVRPKDSNFINCTRGATVENLSIVNSYFHGTGEGYSVSEVVSAFVGRGVGVTLRNLYTDAIVVSGIKDWHTGGICGYAEGNSTYGDATIDSCVFAGTIISTSGDPGDRVGGILGGTNNNQLTVEITNCLMTGTISSNDNHVGGIVGNLRGTSKVSGCVVTTEASYTGTKTSRGPVAGCMDIKWTASNKTYTIANTIENCYYVGTGEAYGTTTETETVKLTNTNNTPGLTLAMGGLDALTNDQKMVNLADDKWYALDNDYPIPTGVKDMYNSLKDIMVAATPTITTEPQGAQYNVGASAGSLTVKATGDATGVLSYQWYMSTTSATDGYTAITGATNNSYTPDVSAAGNTWYYCLVTNTNSIFGSSNNKSSAAALVHVHDWDETKYAKDEEYHWNNVCLFDGCTETDKTQMGSYEKHTNFDNHICAECEYADSASYFDATADFDPDADGIQPEDTSWYVGDGPYTLTTANQLYGLAKLVNAGTDFSGKTIYLGTNIVINEGDASEWASSATGLTGWKPIGTSSNKFKGTFNGNGHYISGVYSSQTKENGLFGYIENATIKNVAVINSLFQNTGSGDGGYRLGSIAAYANAVTVQDVYSSAILNVKNGINDCGGIIGYCTGKSTINSVAFTGKYTDAKSGTTQRLGGIIGCIYGSNTTVSDCLYAGSMDGQFSFGGRIVGRVWNNLTGVKIENCVALGSAKTSAPWPNKTGNTYAGDVTGVLGHTKSPVTFTNCYFPSDCRTIGWDESGIFTDASFATCFNTATVDMDVTAAGLTSWTATTSYPIPKGIEEMYNDLALLEVQINETPISQFQIVYSATATDDHAKSVAEDLAARLSAKYGRTFIVKTDAETAGEHEILIGDTNRDVSSHAAACTEVDEYSISSDGTHVAITAGGHKGLASAVEEFIELICLDKSAKETPEDVTIGDGTVKTSDLYSAMSFNVLYKDNQDGYEERTNRWPKVIEMILKYMPDSVGLQETNGAWNDYLLNDTGTEIAAFREKYQIVTFTYRNGGDSTSTTTTNTNEIICFRKDRYELVSSHTKWLSATPDTPGSKVDDEALLPRIVNFVVLKDKETGKEIIHANTHLGDTHETRGEEFRLLQMAALKSILEEYEGSNIIVTGDFNGVYAEGEGLADGSYFSDPRYYADHATEGFTNSSQNRVIDYCWTEKDTIDAKYYHVCTEKTPWSELAAHGDYASDHRPVYVVFDLQQ